MTNRGVRKEINELFEIGKYLSPTQPLAFMTFPEMEGLYRAVPTYARMHSAVRLADMNMRL